MIWWATLKKVLGCTILMGKVSERFPRSNPNGKLWKRWLCRIKEHIWESVLHAKSLSTPTLTSTLQMLQMFWMQNHFFWQNPSLVPQLLYQCQNYISFYTPEPSEPQVHHVQLHLIAVHICALWCVMCNAWNVWCVVCNTHYTLHITQYTSYLKWAMMFNDVQHV